MRKIIKTLNEFVDDNLVEIDLLKHKYHDSISLREDIVYVVNCDFYDDNDLYLHNNRLYQESTIKGLMKNIKTNIHTVSIIYDNVNFTNCTFKKDSFYDRSIFRNCKFTNCFFYGSMRWCEFDLCNFNDCKLSFDYIRGTTIRKNCNFNNSEIKIKQVDEMVFILSKRYPKYFHPNYYGVDLKL